jgi:hypothetical protein
MLAITTTSERIDHWIRMRRSLAKFSESEASNHTPSLAAFTTTTPELKFSVHTAALLAKWPPRNFQPPPLIAAPPCAVEGLHAYRHVWTKAVLER